MPACNPPTTRIHLLTLAYDASLAAIDSRPLDRFLADKFGSGSTGEGSQVIQMLPFRTGGAEPDELVAIAGGLAETGG